MSTLLMRFAAPLQSWGADAKYENRRGTERTPTKSGVIGLVAAALGLRRNESIEDLRSLRFGVRVDREGSLLRDYHTAKSEKSAYVTNRYYLADAVFLAGLEGDEALLTKIEYALRHPMFPLSLGRRSCPPEGRLSLGIREGKSLIEALREEPWLVSEWLLRKAPPEVTLRIVADADANNEKAYFQRDVPLTFDQKHRQYGFRRVFDHGSFAVSNADGRSPAAERPTKHDPMAELKEE